MIWPTSGQISRRAVPGGHPGLDIAASEGTELRAPFEGVVHLGTDETVNVRPNASLKCPGTGGRGRFITLDHPGGWQTRFFHLSAQLVANGARVRQGDLIGRVGNTGCSTGAHLHMEALRDGQVRADWDDAAPASIQAGAPIPYDFAGLGAPKVDPVGSLDLAEPLADGKGIRIAGWTFDQDAVWVNNSVHVYVDDVGFDIGPAKVSRPDVDAAYPGVTPTHGFDTTVAFTRGGKHKVCAYGINWQGSAGANALLGCKEVTVPNPFGNVDEVTALPSGGGIRVRGWTVDADGIWLNNGIHVYVGKQGFDMGPAKVSRPDVDAAYPGVTPYHGFDAVVPFTAAGTHDVCVYALNAPGTRGDNVLLSCMTITR